MDFGRHPPQVNSSARLIPERCLLCGIAGVVESSIPLHKRQDKFNIVEHSFIEISGTLSASVEYQ